MRKHGTWLGELALPGSSLLSLHNPVARAARALARRDATQAGRYTQNATQAFERGDRPNFEPRARTDILVYSKVPPGSPRSEKGEATREAREAQQNSHCARRARALRGVLFEFRAGAALLHVFT